MGRTGMPDELSRICRGECDLDILIALVPHQCERSEAVQLTYCITEGMYLAWLPFMQ